MQNALDEATDPWGVKVLVGLQSLIASYVRLSCLYTLFIFVSFFLQAERVEM